MRLRKFLAFGAVVGGVAFAAANTAAVGQAAKGVVVGLIQQDASDCQNSTVKDDPNRLRGGTIWVTRNASGSTNVRLGMTAAPNTTYHFNLKCVRQLGDIRTDDEGIGLASFDFQTSAVGAVYGFDMYPEGAPSGNKFQSVTVSFQ